MSMTLSSGLSSFYKSRTHVLNGFIALVFCALKNLLEAYATSDVKYPNLQKLTRRN